MMKTRIFSFALCLLAATATSCVDEVEPTNMATAEQVYASASAQKALLRSIAAKLLMTSTSYAYQNGYDAQVMLAEVYGEDFPIANDVYSYYSYDENATYLLYTGYYVSYFYYSLAGLTNNILRTVDLATASDEAKGSVAVAKTYRAFCYMMLARWFEAFPTNFAQYDSKAEALNCFGLTMPIVTENMTEADARNNPRAPFYTMYRFLLSDLNDAEKYIDYFKHTDLSMPDLSTVCGMQARLWLEMATRFRLSPEDLATQLAHENDNDGFAPLGVRTAQECYQKAIDYAQRAMVGHSPLTREQWYDTQYGFSSATSQNSWMWAKIVSTIDQLDGDYYYTYMGQVNSEAEWALPQYGGAFRMIGKRLYGLIADSDWRKLTWVAPEDAGSEPIPDKYSLSPKLTLEAWQNIPAYTGLKFKVRENQVGWDDSDTQSSGGAVADFPLMRVEEMYFILAEAKTYAEGLAAGQETLKAFMDTYRCTDGNYALGEAIDEDGFVKGELMYQKRIEFWGEGITTFDYKRLRKAIERDYAGSNYIDIYQFHSYEGYAPPWLNMYIYESEQSTNPAIVLNPDPTNVFAK